MVLDVAYALLKESGYKRMTMDEVATRANLGKGTLYLYFDSKEDLAHSCIDRTNQRLQESLKTIARGSKTPTDKLERMLIERVLYRFRAVQGHKAGIDDVLSCLRHELFERRDRWHAAEAQLFAEVLVEGRTKGEFDVDEPFEVASALVTATNSLLPYSLSPRELVERVDVEKRIQRISRILVKGLLSASC
jgi:AcrR family transcriptional regulator